MHVLGGVEWLLVKRWSHNFALRRVGSQAVGRSYTLPPFFIAEATAAYLVHKTHPVHKNGPQAQGVEPSSKRAKRASSEAEEGGEGAESGVDLVFCPRCTFLNDPANARCSLCATSFRLCGGGGGGSGGGSGGGGGGARGAEAQASYPGIDN